jgi:uncharacterized repeat protein (TIGR03803 family)
LVQGSDGNLYGTTSRGGASKFGTVFRIPPKLKPLERLYSFDSTYPNAALIHDSGHRWGLLRELLRDNRTGGANSGGTIFEIAPNGTLTTLYSLCNIGNGCIDGTTPVAGLTQATDGNLYGTTEFGGANGAARSSKSLSAAC